MEYVGENLFIGELGNFFVLSSFAFALLSAISYFLGEFKNASDWTKLGRVAFYAHFASVIGMVGVLFSMIINQYYEYHYVWQHSSDDLPMRYIFSSFWEGIEGSFMLWIFWHAALALIVLFSNKKWEAPVLGTISIVQTFLTSMLLGVFLFSYKVGSNPFTVLTREYPDFVNLPIFDMPNYLEVIDGRGLNPLLQNYWMTIHPPTVLLGFAFTIIPFAFAIGGLLRRDYTGWVKPALPWTFVSIGVLGVGILMGGAWAYEALSFGGFWAWDPVENASLVPWLILVGAGHLMLIQRAKPSSMLSLFLFTLLGFCLSQYSSFLTKSGILGDSSVHSFTDLGMTGQLAFSLIFVTVGSIGLVIYRAKDFPKSASEENLWSREFWMFLGSLVLLISAFQIEFSTSFPVINKIFGTNLAQSAERVEYYNKWQLPLAVILAGIIAVGQFLKYKKTAPRDVLMKLLPSLIISVVLTIVIAITMSMTNPLVILLAFTSLFAAISNTDYFLRILSGKIKKGGSSIAHVGFALILFGAVISTSQSDVISENTSLYDVSVLGEDFNNNENILLMKNDTLLMGDYFVSYQGKEVDGQYIHYEVQYLQPNESGELSEVFTLYPFIQLNPRMGNVAEPYTKHYWHKDVFTHITYAELEERKDEEEVSEHQIQLGDTIFAKSSFMVLDSLNRSPNRTVKGLTINDLALGAHLTLYDVETKSHEVEPLFVIRDRQYSFSVPDSVPVVGIDVSFDGIDPETESFTFTVRERDPKYKEFIVMKAIVFPWINILWIGCVLMGLGVFISVYQRIRRS